MAVSGVSSGNGYRDWWSEHKYDETPPTQEEIDEVLNGTDWGVVFEDEKQGVSVDDFLNLMVAQLRNQDFMNPVDDTQYVTQLAQFATMQQMQELAAYQKTNYAISLVGKNVTAAKFNVSGSLVKETGPIQKVSLVDNSYEVTVNGKSFKLEEIMEINQTGGTATGDGSDGVDVDKSAYLLSLMGKNVVIKHPDGENSVNIQGVVTKVSSENGQYQVQVGGEWYPLNEIISVDGEEPNVELDPEKVSELAGMVGKEVTVRIRDEDGAEDEKTGRVTKISTQGGEYRLMIGGEWYLLGDVLRVREDGDTRNVWFDV